MHQHTRLLIATSTRFIAVQPIGYDFLVVLDHKLHVVCIIRNIVLGEEYTTLALSPRSPMLVYTSGLGLCLHLYKFKANSSIPLANFHNLANDKRPESLEEIFTPTRSSVPTRHGRVINLKFTESVSSLNFEANLPSV